MDDPFGLRKAILPVFRRDVSGRLFGQGTAFHVDGWGTMLTADHVIDFMRQGTRIESNNIVERNPAAVDHVVLMRGMGVVFGSVGIPSSAFLNVIVVQAVSIPDPNPMAALRGESSQQIGIDFSTMVALLGPHERPPASVPVRTKGWRPTMGAYVLACGYPNLAPSKVTPEDREHLISDGLYGAYGRVTAFHPNGLGTSRPGPVFEIEGDWPLGMSGGPVFNDAGEVVGIVSRGLAPDGDSAGAAFAVCLSRMPRLDQLLPTLDLGNPGWRRGYGVVAGTSAGGHLISFHKAPGEAEQSASRLGDGYRVIAASQRVGFPDEYMQL